VHLLHTDRLIVRSWSEVDLDAFFDIYSRDEVTRWLGPQPRTPVADRAEAEARLRRWIEFSAGLEPPYGLWAVVPVPATSPVGTVLLLPLSDAAGRTDLVEIGWHLHPDYWGNGYATEAAGALLAAAYDAEVGEVLALTDPDNGPSQAVAGRLGLADEGLTDRWFGLTTRQFRLARVPTLDS
jgi:RimJ/RimL family protein N-acetyltransferase